jgi:hypothetical protein
VDELTIVQKKARREEKALRTMVLSPSPSLSTPNSSLLHHHLCFRFSLSLSLSEFLA